MDPITTPLGYEEIQKYIPHRYPLLLVDRVLEVKPFETLHAIKMVSMTDPFLPGHFPGHPVYPGVLIVEGMAQASCILTMISQGEDASVLPLLTEISKARFRQPARPGDVMHFHISLIKRRGSYYLFEGRTEIDGKISASAHFSAMMMPQKNPEP